MMEKITNLPEWLRNGIFVVVGGAMGWFASQYMDYRSAYRESLETNYESFNEVAKEIEQSLRLFADVTRGVREKSTEDVEQLQLKLLNAVTVADDLHRRIRADESVLRNFRSAAVEVQRASELVTGPIDGRQMVSAVSDFLVAEQDLRDVVIAERNSFF